MLGFPLLYFKGMRLMMFQLSGFCYILLLLALAWACCEYLKDHGT